MANISRKQFCQKEKSFSTTGLYSFLGNMNPLKSWNQKSSWALSFVFLVLSILISILSFFQTESFALQTICLTKDSALSSIVQESLISIDSNSKQWKEGVYQFLGTLSSNKKDLKSETNSEYSDFHLSLVNYRPGSAVFIPLLVLTISQSRAPPFLV